jgi:hypothetical protein
VRSTPQLLSSRANNLFRASFAEGRRVQFEMPEFKEAKDEKERNRLSIAQKILTESAQLAGQIIRSLNSGCLLLGLIGLRSLVENLINAKYAFAHPDRVGDMSHVYRVCGDYYSRGNFLPWEEVKSGLPEKKLPKLFKQWRDSDLDGVSIYKRAQQVDLLPVYYETYASLCKYSHLSIRTGALNNPALFERFTGNGYVCALTTLHDIQEYVRLHFEIKGNQEQDDRLIQFQSQYLDNSTEKVNAHSKSTA